MATEVQELASEITELDSVIVQKELEILRLTRELAGEREQREKLDAALRGKEKAMDELVTYCTAKGLDLSHFFS